MGITILQHSLERKHPLNSTRIATLGLKNVAVASVSDVNFEAQLVIRLLESGLDRHGSESLDFEQGLGYRETLMGVNSKKKTKGDPIGTIAGEKEEDCVVTATIGKYGLIDSLTHVWMSQTDSQKPNFDHILSSPQALDALAKGFVVKRLQKRQASEEEEEEFEIVVPPGSVLLFPSERSVGVGEIDFEVKNLIVLDGTWAKAKRMYNENPWLKLLPHLKLEVEKMSLYSEVRQQPKIGYLSTIESIVYSLKAVGDDNPEGLEGLLDVFESMVGDQRECKEDRLRTASLFSTVKSKPSMPNCLSSSL